MSKVRTVTHLSGLDKRQIGAARGIRTPDPVITNDVLYRLSYCGPKRRPPGPPFVAFPLLLRQAFVNLAAGQRRRPPHQTPMFGADDQGSAGACAAPRCNSSIEMLSGVRTNAIPAVARGAVDDDAGVAQARAIGVDVVDLVGEVAEVAAAAKRLPGPS